MTAMRYPTVTPPAEALGVTQPVLTTQLQELKRDVGAALYVRAERGQRQEATAAGCSLIREFATLQQRPTQSPG